ncbi:hypothetical protein SCUCBS95973_001812 [Sporothrix curviconia]|uniref:Uncharacterized protein n=1 Tax=Sporothrix curviconia TaxID=1260050 RepID=A0ABP0B1P9_9PEZI
MPLLWNCLWAARDASSATVLLSTSAFIVGAVFALAVAVCVNRLVFHPLARVPGPWAAGCSSLWLAWHTFIGDECTAVQKMHKKYGPVLRVGPSDIDISDPNAVGPIYVERGGFPKTQNYSMFDVDGHATVFSTLAREDRLPRARAVAPLFSTASIRLASNHGGTHAAVGELASVLDRFVVRLKAEGDRSRTSGEAVDVLNLTRSLALDAISSYLFQLPYGALEEGSSSSTDGGKPGEKSNGSGDGNVMSASPFVDAFVGVSAFFNIRAWLPAWDVPLMEFIDRFTGTITTSQTNASMQKIDNFAARVVDSAVPDSGSRASYASRLLAMGEKAESMPREAWRAQVRAECKDVCFAGTDSSGMNMAMLLWQLAGHPAQYARLKREVADAVAAGEDPTTNAYVRAVVRESLRLAWANPIRLPRSVPEHGWTFGGFFFPAGTSVGVAAFELHLDETVFPEPLEYRPERWLVVEDEDEDEGSEGKGSRTSRMQAQFFAFGKGGRACIGQNLGMAELHLVAAAVARTDALQGATPVQSHVAIQEWFNARVVGEKILLKFS